MHSLQEDYAVYSRSRWHFNTYDVVFAAIHVTTDQQMTICHTWARIASWHWPMVSDVLPADHVSFLWWQRCSFLSPGAKLSITQSPSNSHQYCVWREAKLKN